MSEKLQKVLAAKGLGSRREIERWISAGRISVNGKTATLGDRVTGEDRIQVDGKPVSGQAISHRYLLYNKPEGEICTRDDPDGRRTVFDSLPALRNQRWISVGRLDFNTSGLLLFTTDGELANKLMHPSSNIEREYAVRVLGSVTNDALDNMRHGVLLEDGISRFSDIQRARKAEDSEGSANQWFYVVLMEGKNREVRRLWESQGFTISRLKRVRYGSFFIPSAVKAGQFTDIKPKDIPELYLMAGLEQSQQN
ncbi:MAG: rRNA pseudouridine synthase [Gammaproteobacteria bacterium]|jgi:23S rRNA pseudouridine2605 synthase|nr:rRNA pseudouridine synthase [Gammaproteobacteria bacterium]MBT7369184.1 rRNA pseudouridine synthase [Gammaproteobacteria bacterium]